jgi:hypothetical protein
MNISFPTVPNKGLAPRDKARGHRAFARAVAGKLGEFWRGVLAARRGERIRKAE